MLLEIAARPWLRRLSEEAGHAVSLEAVPDGELDRIRSRGFQAVWLMGVWTTGARGRFAALSIPSLLAEYERILPDWEPVDVQGSPYSIAAYEVSPTLGGDAALDGLRARLRERGIGLVLDFVPNHLATDHPWLDTRPDRFVRGTARDLARDAGAWFVHTTPEGHDRIYAHGRDPYFPAWTDTCQLDYRRADTRDAMASQLVEIAARCDGLRCDMAMLLLPDVFRTTWGDLPGSDAGDFWTDAVAAVRREHPQTVLCAEVYWGLEDRLRAAGFDFTYDKDLYDGLVAGDIARVRERARAPESDHRHRVRFLENHDEARALETFGPDRLRAAAAVAYGLPGMRFFHDGQVEGRRTRTPVQLARAPREADVEWCRDFHERLLTLLAHDVFHHGAWSHLAFDDAAPESTLVGSRWTLGDETRVIVANLGPDPVSARVPVPVPAEGAAVVSGEDLLRGEPLQWNRKELREPGLELRVAGGRSQILRIAAPSS